jgi:hypothetical protein
VYGRGNRHCGKTKREDTTLFKILAVKDGAYICFLFFYGVCSGARAFICIFGSEIGCMLDGSLGSRDISLVLGYFLLDLYMI